MLCADTQGFHMVTRLVSHFGFHVTILKVIPIEDMANQGLLSSTSATIDDPEQTRTWSHSAQCLHSSCPLTGIFRGIPAVVCIFNPGVYAWSGRRLQSLCL